MIDEVWGQIDGRLHGGAGGSVPQQFYPDSRTKANSMLTLDFNAQSESLVVPRAYSFQAASRPPA